MKKILCFVLMVALIILCVPTTEASIFDNTFDINTFEIVSNKYSSILRAWKEEGIRDDINYVGIVQPSSFAFENEVGSLINDDHDYDTFLNDEALPSEYLGQVFQFNQTVNAPQSIQMVVDVPEEGLYKIGFDYYSQTTSINDIKLAIKVNGQTPFYEASQLTLKTLWETSHEFSRDRFGNDIMPNASQINRWVHTDLQDASRLYEQGLLFKFNAGQNTIELTRNEGFFLLGQVYVSTYERYIDYETYLTQHTTDVVEEELYTIQAEKPAFKNEVSIRFGTDRNPRNIPFSIIESRLNVVDGATFDNSGQSIFYEVEVNQTGYYYITIKAKQGKANSGVYRTLTLDGKVPFKEAERIFFPSMDWENVTLKDKDGNPYKFYLEQGKHTLGLTVNSSPMQPIYEQIETVMLAVNNLALDIKKLTGNQLDENRDWEITDYMPNIKADMTAFGDAIKEAYDEWIKVNKTKVESEVSAGLKAAYGWLYELAEKPNEIPAKINRLTGTTSSVMQRLGIVLPLTIASPLTMDAIYVHGSKAELPQPRPGFFEGIWVEIQRFFTAIFSNQFGVKNSDEELNIWVNRSRQYVNLMQQIVDDEFTTQTGIKVKISLMPDVNKLILATASGTQPDIAMGIAGWRPYDYAIRNALVDLRSFDTFSSVAENFKPGAFMQLIYQEGVYGLPETQNFYVLFYRSDILNNLNLEVPDTWNDVIDMLPELQRYGMNFYSMLSGTSAFKAFVTTMPFIMQQGASLYTEGALGTTLDSEEMINAMTLMTDLYTVYALPLEVGSFYNQFRYGNMPVGVGDFGMYVQLLYAAPEIAGLWNIAPLPGIHQNGEVKRYYDGASTSSVIFKNSKKQQEAWQFLEWWTSTNVQVNYAESLMNSLGSEYMWNTANYHAFNQLNWNASHKAVFLEQWNWVLDTPKTPASYMLEREISNAWNKIVYDGISIRTAMEDAEVIVNKEIRRKMIEFGFIDNQGNVLKPYLLPSAETLHEWLGGQ